MLVITSGVVGGYCMSDTDPSLPQFSSEVEDYRLNITFTQATISFAASGASLLVESGWCVSSRRRHLIPA